MPNPTPEPKPLDAERLDDEALSGIRHFYASIDPTKLAEGPTSAAANVVYLLRHITAQDATIAALTAELAERKRREEQVQQLVEAATALDAVYENPVIEGQSTTKRLVVGAQRLRAALAPFSTEQGK